MGDNVRGTQLNTMEPTAPLSDERITINVGGRRFQTLASTLRRLPNSLLGDEKRRAAYYDAVRGEFFFDRSGAGFDAVLAMYRNCGERVQRPQHVSPQLFADDLRFFGVDQMTLGAGPAAEPVRPGWRGTVWAVLEPGGGRPPALPVLSALVTIIAILAWVMPTVPTLQHSAGDCTWVQLVCALLLLLELLCRAAVHPQPLQLLTDPLTWVDLIATLFFIIGFAMMQELYAAWWRPWSSVRYQAAIWLMRLAQLAWPIRLWRCVRRTRPAAVLTRTLAASAGYLGAYLTLWLIGVLFFATIFYWTESMDNYAIESVPTSIYFTVIAMTTVGFGDLYTMTTVGRVFCSLCCYFGQFMTSLPIAVVVAKFARFSMEDAA